MITRTTIAAMVAAAPLLSMSLVPRVHAGQPRYDLTGTWTGAIKCKTLSHGVKDKFTLTPTMKVSQSGLNIGVLLDYGGGDTEFYTGLANPDAKKPLEKGQLALVFCGTDDIVGNDPTYDELGTMAVSTKPLDFKASFKGASIFSDPGTIEAEVGTCKWKWTRKDMVPPNPMVATGCAM